MNEQRANGTPLLSICIATFERAHLLNETLESIVPQLRDKDVELVIVDGASTDNTEEVVRSFMGQSSHVRYYKLPTKGGVDEDFRKGLELASGEYCWFFCDDDLFENGAIERVLEGLRTHAPDLLVVNCRVWDSEHNCVLEENRLGIEGNQVYTQGQGQRLFCDLVTHISYIGAVVIRRQFWLERPHKRYSGSEFAHIGVIFHEPLPGKAVFIERPLVKIRFMSTQWAPRMFKIWMINWPELIWSFEWIAFGARQSVVSRHPWRNILRLAILRAKGHYDMSSYARYIREKEPRLLYRAPALVIAAVPGSIFQLLALACYLLFAPHRKMGILELRRSRFALGSKAR